MINKICKHKWIIKRRSGISNGNVIPALFECEKCKIKMHSSEVVQFETLNHLTGFQKWLSIIAIIISIMALVISFLTYL